jgi:hypothetical protein
MKCKVCNSDAVSYSTTIKVNGKDKFLSFDQCVKCHRLLDNEGDYLPLSEKVDSNEEDFLRSTMGGGSNPASGL